MKPILFNTDMVRAILDGRKTVTRRVIKPQPTHCTMSKAGLVVSEKPIEISDGIIKAANAEVRKPPFEAGDILYVRETWHKDVGRYMFKANYTDTEKFFRDGKEVQIKWRPSIHMPKEASRLFLRVTDVRVERLREISALSAMDEGVTDWNDFVKLWDSTTKPTDRETYGWSANPWVFVIEFERISRDAALKGGDAG